MDVSSDQKTKTEDERILGVQLELFPSADAIDLQRTLFLLKQYPEMKIRVDDYKKHEDEIKLTIYEGEIARKLEADELHADKPANAIILAINQKAAAERIDVMKKAIERAVGLILNRDARDAVHLRYLQGYTYAETLKFMYRGVKSTTLDRRLADGLASVANTLKDWGMIGE